MPSRIAVVGILGLWASAAFAATPEQTCRAQKLVHAGSYALCRAKADAKAEKKGEPADYARCTEKIALKFAKAEEKAGLGVCPTEADTGPIADLLDAATGVVAEQLEAPDPGCPPGYRDRTPGQVIQDLLAAAGAQNVPLILCNYHPTAHVIDDQGILVGHADIAAAFASLWELFDGVTPTVQQIDVFESSGRLLYSLDAGWVEIEDGVETFEFERGRIRSQARHGLITFNGPPPD